MREQRKWYQMNGPEGDVVISTRIRLARNLQKYPFPTSMTLEQRQEVCKAVREAVQNRCANVGKFTYLDMTKLPAHAAGSMVERHLISPEFAKGEAGSGLMLTDDESVSLMLVEEDHIRLQVMRPGLMLREAYEMADQLDTALDETLHFAFDDRLGYLTQCPSNLGTGMRASLMLHLPALQEKGVLGQLAQTVSKLGLTIRGMYGEGSRSKGAIYQLSNQVSLGISEQDAINNLKSIAEQIIREERAQRKELCESVRFEDRIWRSVGILSCARTLDSDESLQLLSNVMIGISCGLVGDLTLEQMHTLMNRLQPSTLMLDAKKDLDADQRDVARADLIRQVFRKEAV
jgi:protein arginine kinase